MAEFYVTYDVNDEHFLAIVLAPQRPAIFGFASMEEVNRAMDALGHPWELCSAIRVPNQPSADWLERMALNGSLKRLPRPDRYLFGMGGISGELP